MRRIFNLSALQQEVKDTFKREIVTNNKKFNAELKTLWININKLHERILCLENGRK